MSIESVVNNVEQLSNQQHEARMQFIDRVLTVSSGALAFSVTFRDSVAGEAARAVWLLQLAWCLLALCTIISTYLHLSKASSASRLIKGLQAAAARGDYESREIAGAHPVFQYGYEILKFAFLGAIAALAAFGVINV